MRNENHKRAYFFIGLVSMFIFANSNSAQTTAFNYQGHLTDGGSPANGSFQMQFKLFDSLAGGTQIGPTIADLPVTAAQGIFSARLDFGSNALSGANRWLEIAVRHNAGEGYTTLTPREQVNSSPYSIRTLSAASADLAFDSQKLGGVNASQFVQTTDPRLSDARNPLPGSTNYIQNTTTAQSANFNIGGVGTVGTLAVTNGMSAGGGGQFGGNMTFGPTSSNSKVSITGQDALRMFGFQPYLTLTDTNASNKSSFMQNVNGDAILLTNSRAPFTVKDLSGDVLVSGNASQPAGATGLLKYGILVNSNGTLNLCYSAANPTACGVTVSHPTAGQYDLTFPVQINSRIFSATTVLTSSFNLDAADEIYVRPTGQQTLRVRTASYGYIQGDFDTGFYLVVY